MPRIAILLANNDESSFSTRFPNDGEKVAVQLLQVRPQWECRVWPVKDGVFPRCTDADAFVITGSPASVHDPLPWIVPLKTLIRDIHLEALPLIGLCFGHQIIASALGGNVEVSLSGWRFGAVETQFERLRHWMRPEKKMLRLFASHSEQVTQLPTGATRLGSSPDCPNAAFAIKEHILTTQYHPEFSADFMKELAYEYEGDLPQAVLKAGRYELDLPSDGSIFFQWIAEFIESATVLRMKRATRSKQGEQLGRDAKGRLVSLQSTNLRPAGLDPHDLAQRQGDDHIAAMDKEHKSVRKRRSKS